jgi:hypothetical protein
MCPHCGQNAPVVYRGVLAYCTACNTPRPPLTGKALHLAGKTSRVGGAFARVAGWIVVATGLAFAFALGGILQLLFGGAMGLIVGGPIAFVSVVVAVLLLRGGSRLEARGADAGHRAQEQAVFALAAHKSAALTVNDVALALEIPVPEAETLMTALARERYEQIRVDLDAQGTLVYRFGPQPTTRVRVDPELAESPNRDEWERLEADAARERQRGGRG